MRSSVLTVVLAMFVVSEGCTGQSTRPNILDKALGCLAGQDWVMDDLRDIGLTVGQRVAVRQRREAIPDISPSTPETTNVLVLNRSGRKGWLFFYKSEVDGNITLVRNAYRVEKSEGGWSAGEGNGGLATYKAIAKYSAGLAAKSPVHLKLTPASSGCRIE